VNKRAGIVVAGLGCLILTGCMGKGEVVQLNLHAVPPPGAANVHLPSDTIVVVAEFEDGRTNRQRVGARVHQGGGETVFNVWNGKAGLVVAQVVTDYLKARGWKVDLAKTGTGTAPDGGPHVTISGRVVELAVEAKSAFGSTQLAAASRLVVEAVNAEDGSIVRMTLKGAASQTVVVFEQADAEQLLSAALSESLEKFVAETTVEKKIMKLKP
jgi:hypothetical protein